MQQTLLNIQLDLIACLLSTDGVSVQTDERRPEILSNTMSKRDSNHEMFLKFKIQIKWEESFKKKKQLSCNFRYSQFSLKFSYKLDNLMKQFKF